LDPPESPGFIEVGKVATLIPAIAKDPIDQRLFDWARGSVLKRMMQASLPFATYDAWLKGWACAWPIALLEVPPGSRVLDVGCGSHPYYAQYFLKKGCEAHGMDAKYEEEKMKKGWGISPETIADNPDIHFHLGLAGDGVGPEKYFDLVTCISIVEHIYDSTFVLDPDNPMRHMAALRDMLRMLKPGGVLALTYDFFLNDMPHWRGWDYLADIQTLELNGVPLLSRERLLRTRTYIYNHEDTLFMQPEGILSFSDKYLRSTSIGMMFRKPGDFESKVQLSPNPALRNVLFPPSETSEPSPKA